MQHLRGRIAKSDVRTTYVPPHTTYLRIQHCVSALRCRDKYVSCIKFCGLWQPRKITTKISRYMYNNCLYLPPIWIVYSSLTMYVDDFAAFLAHTIHKRPSHLSTWDFPSTASLTQSVSSLHISGDLLEHFGLSDYLPTQLHAAAIYGELAQTV